MKPVLSFMHTDGQIFGSSIVSVFQNFGWGKTKLLLLTFTTTYFAEQGVSQVLHTRNNYSNWFDTNKAGGNAMRLKLTNLQPALKKLTDEHQA